MEINIGYAESILLSVIHIAVFMLSVKRIMINDLIGMIVLSAINAFCSKFTMEAYSELLPFLSVSFQDTSNIYEVSQVIAGTGLFLAPACLELIDRLTSKLRLEANISLNKSDLRL